MTDPLHPGRPVAALTIAGSDPSGGAGIQADLKAFSALGAYGMSVITALTAQSTQGVAGVLTLPPDFVALQLEALASDVRLDAVKVGMLGDAAVAETVAEGLDLLREIHPGLPVVVDPVLASTSGVVLTDASDPLLDVLARASLLTPNLAEAAILLGEPEASTPDEMADQGRRLLGLGCERVLVKGGHAQGDPVDVLVDADGFTPIPGRRVATTNTHGTGCSLSSAITALVPRRDSWADAVRDAKEWLIGALEHADELEIGQGAGPVHHFYRSM